MKIVPTDIDKRAAGGFQVLAEESSFFPVTCRFRKVVKTKEGIGHQFWLEGAREFRECFGNPANFFAGAFEYVRLATGWEYPYLGLQVMVHNSRKHQISGGYAFYPPGLSNTKDGEIRVIWANGEFTLTVFHELVHLFKRGAEEDWVEQQALKLTLGV